MRRLWISAIVFLTFLTIFFTPSTAIAQVDCTTQRCSDCDVCGYCRIPRTGEPNKPTPVQVPGNWQQCRQCLYPDFPGVGATDRMDALSNRTLEVNNDTSSQFYNIQTTPRPGRYFTQVGCVVTDIGDFTDAENQGNAVNFILRGIFNISGGIAFLYLIYGAFLIMTARGEPVRLNQGRSVVFGAIYGLIFVILSTLILNLVGGQILRIPGFGG